MSKPDTCMHITLPRRGKLCIAVYTEQPKWYATHASYISILIITGIIYWSVIILDHSLQLSMFNSRSPILPQMSEAITMQTAIINNCAEHVATRRLGCQNKVHGNILSTMNEYYMSKQSHVYITTCKICKEHIAARVHGITYKLIQHYS